MDAIFGIPMDAIMVFFVILLVLCLSTAAYVAIRRPVVFKMGMRNIPRRKAQTVLILVGLMLATVISTAALGMGDTIDRSLTATTYEVLGEVDEVIVRSPELEANVNNALADRFPASELQRIEQAVAGNEDIDGLMPALLEFVPAINMDTQLSTPQVFIIGIDPARVDQFGGLNTLDGEPIDLNALPPDAVVISESTAEELDAAAGDQVTIFYGGQPLTFTVAAVAPNSPLTGVLNSDENPGMVVPLERLQAGTNQQDQISMIMVSNRGDVRSGVDLTEQVVDALEPVLAGHQLGIDSIKQTFIDLSEGVSSALTGLFLVLGLFSIAVGVLLIILIFSMLAAERRAEMGMARAVGQQRFQLIQQFISEGTGYALLSGIVGVAVGVGVTYLLATIFSGLVGDFFTIEPFVTWRSAIIGYCLGVVITFLAIVVASWRASRLNVVAAIRDLPDVTNPKRKLRTLINGLLMLIVGGLMVYGGLAGDAAQAFLLYFGLSLIPFGVALLARYLGAPSRPVFTAVGILILVLWFMPTDVMVDIFGEAAGGGDFEMFFLSGIFMVTGATILIVQNLDLLLAGLNRLSGLFKSRIPAVRLAVAYPGSNTSRTGLTVAMFSLIIFSLVCFSAISENFSNVFINDDADAGWDVLVDVDAANQIPNKDLVAALNAAGVDTSDIEEVGWTDWLAAAAGARQLTSPDEGFTPENEYSTVTLTGMDASFITGSILTFQNRATGYESDQAIVDALLNEPNVAIIDASAISGGEGFAFGGTTYSLEGLESDSEGFAPIEVELIGQSGQTTVVRIIGILDQDLSTLFGMYVNRASVEQIFPDPATTSYRVKLSDSSKADERAKEFEAALLQHGAQAQSFEEILNESQGIFRGFLALIQGFMGLGLIVGIAAVGVIAFRSVVERRQQIGILRAIGFQSSLVSLGFIIETIFVVGLGVISGTILALALSWQLFQDPDFTGGADVDGFVVPWSLVGIVLAIAFGFALLMTWIPSRQAAQIRPAEALRYE